MVYPLVNVINVEVNYVLSVYVVIMKIIVNSIYLFINFTRKDSLMKGLLSPLRILLTWLHFIHVQSYDVFCSCRNLIKVGSYLIRTSCIIINRKKINKKINVKKITNLRNIRPCTIHKC